MKAIIYILKMAQGLQIYNFADFYILIGLVVYILFTLTPLFAIKNPFSALGILTIIAVASYYFKKSFVFRSTINKMINICGFIFNQLCLALLYIINIFQTLISIEFPMRWM